MNLEVNSDLVVKPSEELLSRASTGAASDKGVPFSLKNLQEGKRYILRDRQLFPCQPFVNPSTLENLPISESVINVLHKLNGRLVLECDFWFISKSGAGIWPAETQAMRLVREHTAVPVPEVLREQFYSDSKGIIDMTPIEGTTLDKLWDTFDDGKKKAICRQTWHFIADIEPIQCPFKSVFQCNADGSPSRHVFLEDVQELRRPIANDDELRARIYERYYTSNGRKYEGKLFDMLPRSGRQVFAHGDIAPRNIMVGEDGAITGIIDWEWGGWYPDWWEYAHIMGPANLRYGDWREYMHETAPMTWDLSGIDAARRVLF
ncbi:hypothetical protein KEM55_005205 [Ascosphaera atra]|nr:hypothetical protein KEM55_005205 [Ascosphaera atra]